MKMKKEIEELAIAFFVFFLSFTADPEPPSQVITRPRVTRQPDDTIPGLNFRENPPGFSG